MTIFKILESKTETGQGSKKEKDTSKKGNTKDTSKVMARKGRVKVYSTIAKALEQGSVGQIFSTQGSDRLYVISKAGWGAKSSGKIAKGFTPGSSTPSSKWKSIKAHSIRTMLKHGTAKSKRLMKKYGPGAADKIDNSKKAAAGGRHAV